MNFRTMDDVKGKKDEKQPDDKKKREVYVGGGATGQAVEDPNEPIAQKIIRQAEQNSKRPGEEDTSAKDKGKPDVIVTLYQDGFVTSDDEKNFRFYTDPENKKFLEELLAGYVPQQMARKFNRNVSIAIDDKRQTAYAKAHPEVNHFRGNAQTLGGAQAPAPGAKPQAPPKPLGDSLSTEFPVNRGLPVHELQLKFKTGEKKVIQVNETSTVPQVLQYVRAVTKQHAVKITTAYPKNDITTSNRTLKEHDLMDASVDVSW